MDTSRDCSPLSPALGHKKAIKEQGGEAECKQGASDKFRKCQSQFPGISVIWSLDCLKQYCMHAQFSALENTSFVYFSFFLAKWITPGLTEEINQKLVASVWVESIATQEQGDYVFLKGIFLCSSQFRQYLMSGMK